MEVNNKKSNNLCVVSFNRGIVLVNSSNTSVNLFILSLD